MRELERGLERGCYHTAHMVDKHINKGEWEMDRLIDGGIDE